MTLSVETRIGDWMVALKQIAPLSPGDSVARATRLLRARSVPLLPVSDGFQMVGVVTESDLLEVAMSAAEPQTFARTTPVSLVMRPVSLALFVQQPLSEAARELVRLGLPAAPVFGSDGRYLGLLLRRDVLAAVNGEPPPVSIAGLATPLRRVLDDRSASSRSGESRVGFNRGTPGAGGRLDGSGNGLAYQAVAAGIAPGK